MLQSSTPGLSENIHLWVDVVHGALTSVAIVVGAMWAYIRFVKERTLSVRADLTQEVVALHLQQGYRLLHVTVQVKNVGNVRIVPSDGYTLLMQVSPSTHTGTVIDQHVASERKIAEAWRREASALPTDQANKDALLEEDGLEMDWPELAVRRYGRSAEPSERTEIDAGETERWDIDFVVADAVEVVAIFTQLVLDPKSDEGWFLTTLQDLREEAEPRRTVTRSRA